MVLYNTLTRKKEKFTPIDGKTARIYSCGPTVYSTAHIGNLRAYIFTDILKKTLQFAGFKVLDVMNATDVGHLVTDADEGEDKIERAARTQHKTPQEIAKQYTDEFFRDCALLNIRRPQIIAPATEYIDDMIEFIKVLEQRGFTYTTTDGVYFDSSKFDGYNKLSRTSIENNIAGARVEMGEKRNPHDFALWKFVDEKTLQKWENPWGGCGCPGWHIECSAIARKHLGDTFDIHTGGIDHIPIHHTNEIAQSESMTGKPMANFWMHNEFMTIDGGKMSKSLGNTYTIADLQSRGFAPLDFRYLCMLTHYRSILNFTWTALTSAKTAYGNLIAQTVKHAQATISTSIPTNKPTPAATNATAPKDFRAEFESAMFDDLNTPRAVAVIWDMLKQSPSQEIYKQILEFDKILSLGIESAVAQYIEKQSAEIPQSIRDLADRRLAAKSAKNFSLADQIRDELAILGYEIKDTKDGYEISKT